MIFRDELAAFSTEVRAAIQELQEQAAKNQVHENDLLLVFNCATVDELGPMLGYDHIVHAAVEQSRFISEVRKALTVDDQAEMDRQRMQALTPVVESIAIHAELTLYIKFWESDYYQRLLYQLSNLASGDAYDWKIKITGDASSLIKGVRKRLGRPAPLVSALLKNLYSNELRNAIAHSQFYVAGDHLQTLSPTGEPSEVLPLRDWRRIISKTLLLHNELQALEDRVLADYRKKAEGKNWRLPIKMTTEGTPSEMDVSPVSGRKYWAWTENLKKSGFDISPEGYV